MNISNENVFRIVVFLRLGIVGVILTVCLAGDDRRYVVVFCFGGLVGGSVCSVSRKTHQKQTRTHRHGTLLSICALITRLQAAVAAAQEAVLCVCVEQMIWVCIHLIST